MTEGWISTKDRMPEDHEMVLGYTPCDGVMFVGFHKVYRYSWGDDAKWYIATAMGSTKTMRKRVSHWMPLPAPPTGMVHNE